MKKLIEFTKAIRNFNAESYLSLKLKAINNFFLHNGLDSCVVGLSGGVDSAVVFLLLLRASKEEGSPIKEVRGVFLPINTTGITGQDEAEKRVNDLINSALTTDMASSKLCGSFAVRDLTPAVRALVNQFPNGLTPWTLGQMACIVRTPALYGEAAYMQQKGLKSLVVGTTNYDEGSYIGFFGKASDAMVDLQPIADIHKSEVYQIAKLLGVPNSIINETPKGDVWDARVDEEMIGAPYWFLEMYLEYKVLTGKNEKEFDKLYKDLSMDDEALFYKYSLAIEKIHSSNAHKYDVGSPAHYIDVIPRRLKGKS